MKIEISNQPIYLNHLNDVIHIIEDAKKRYLIQLDFNGIELPMPEWGYNQPSDVVEIVIGRFYGKELLKTSIIVNAIKNLKTHKLISYANKALEYIIKRINCDRIKAYKILDC